MSKSFGVCTWWWQLLWLCPGPFGFFLHSESFSERWNSQIKWHFTLLGKCERVAPRMGGMADGTGHHRAALCAGAAGWAGAGWPWRPTVAPFHVASHPGDSSFHSCTQVNTLTPWRTTSNPELRVLTLAGGLLRSSSHCSQGRRSPVALKGDQHDQSQNSTFKKSQVWLI